MHRVALKSLRRSNLMSCQFMNIVPVHWCKNKEIHRNEAKVHSPPFAGLRYYVANMADRSVRNLPELERPFD